MNIPDALDDVFDGDREEFEAAVELTQEFSTHPAKYKLSFEFDPQLRALPHSKQDMELYAAILVAQARLQLDEDDQSKVVSMLGQAGAFQSMLGNIELAETYLSSALEYADTFDCNEGVVVQQWLRLGDVLRLQGDFEEATEAFEGAIKAISENQSLKGFENFALQHFAKVFFDQKNFSKAGELFQAALNLRREEQKADLVASSEYGLKRCLELSNAKDV